jgi:bifunctional non-homologous end joining protein LigD
MSPTLIAKPFHRDGWVYEEKVDGYRMLAYKAGPRVQLLSRHGIDHARRYPDVAGAIAALPVTTAVLDGELAVFDQQLRSRFDWLRHRQPAEIATPPAPDRLRPALPQGP